LGTAAGPFVAHAIVRVKQKRGNRIRRLPLWVERLRENYLVFFSIVSVFFSSIFSVDFSLAFLVRLVLAFAPFDFVLPVSSLVELDFSVAVSFFFSVAGGVAGLAGVAGVAWAKLAALNTNVIATKTKALIAFFTESPPFGWLDAGLLLVFKSLEGAIA
jgi:hypothetical protein